MCIRDSPSALKSVKEILDNQVLSMVLKCLRHEFDHNVLDLYFDNLKHNKNTRNNKFSLKLPPIKLEIARASFYFGGVKIFNKLPLEIRKTILT